MAKTREHFEQMSMDEIRSEIHQGGLSALELAFARTVIKSKEKELIEISDVNLEEKITQIIEFGDHKQKRDLCKWIGENEDYSQLSSEVKNKIMKLNLTPKEEVVEKSQKIVENKKSENIIKSPAQSKNKIQTKTAQIKILYEQGMGIAAIAKSLDAHYSFVWGVVKKYKNISK